VQNVDQINQITSRHIARILTQFEEANIPSVFRDAVKREMWYMADDIKYVVSPGKEKGKCSIINSISATI